MLNNTDKIPAEIKSDNLPFPLEYQQKDAKNGERIVMPTHIMA